MTIEAIQNKELKVQLSTREEYRGQKFYIEVLVQK